MSDGELAEGLERAITNLARYASRSDLMALQRAWERLQELAEDDDDSDYLSSSDFFKLGD